MKQSNKNKLETISIWSVKTGVPAPLFLSRGFAAIAVVKCQLTADSKADLSTSSVLGPGNGEHNQFVMVSSLQ